MELNTNVSFQSVATKLFGNDKTKLGDLDSLPSEDYNRRIRITDVDNHVPYEFMGDNVSETSSGSSYVPKYARSNSFSSLSSEDRTFPLHPETAAMLLQVSVYTEKLLVMGNLLYELFTELSSVKQGYWRSRVYLKVCSLYNICTGDSLSANIIDISLYTTSRTYADGKFGTNVVTNFINSILLTCERDIELFKDTIDRYEAESWDTLKRCLTVVNENASDLLSLFKSEFFQKIGVLCSLLLCVPMLNSMGITPKTFGYNDVTEAFLRKDFYKQGVSAPVMILEAASSVALKLSDLFTCGPSVLYVSRQDYSFFEQEYQWLRTNSKNFSCRTQVRDAQGRPDPFTLEGYNLRCVRALELADKIKPTLQRNKFAFTRLETLRFKILDFQSECCGALQANDKRPLPYAVMLCGAPSIGKSTLKDILFKQMHDTDNRTGRFEVPYDPDKNVYVYNPNDDFYSGFSTAHTSILLDDVAQKKADIMKQLGGDDINDLIRIINCVPFSPNQAELEKKGKTPMRCRYVIGTTNTPSLNAQHIFECPTAVYRRMLFVEAEVLPEYRDKIGVGLSGDKSNSLNLDLWAFKIVRYFPAGKGFHKLFLDPSKGMENPSWVTNEEWCTIKDLVTFVNIDIQVHWSKQDKALSAVEALLSQSLCRCGISPLICKNSCPQYKGEIVTKCECGIARDICNGSCFRPEAMNTFYTDYVLDFSVLIVSCFMPWWLSITAVGLYTYERQVHLKQFMEDLKALFLMIPLLPLLSWAVLSEKLSPAPPDAPLRWPLKMCMKIVPHLPDGVILRRLMLLNYIPENQVRWFTKNFYVDWLSTKLLHMEDGYNWFRTNVVEDWKFKGIVIFITVTSLVRKLFKATTMFEFHGEAMVESKPIKHEIAESPRSVWVKDMKIGVFPNAGATVNTQDLETQMLLNTVILQFTGPFGGRRSNGFILRGNLVVTTAHQFNGQCPTSFKLEKINKSARDTIIECACDASNVHILDERDLCFLRVDRLPPGKNLVKYLPSNVEPIHINCPGVVRFLDPTSGSDNKKSLEVKRIEIARIYKDVVLKEYVSEGVKRNNIDKLTGVYNGVTNIGYCGAPILALQGAQKMIAGIHCASNGKGVAMINPVYVEDVDLIERNLCPLMMFDDAHFDVAKVMNAEAMKLVEVHPKCITNTLQGEYETIGGSVLPRAKLRTFVKESPYAKEVVNFYKGVSRFDKILHTSPIHCDPKAAMLLSVEQAVNNADFFPIEIDLAVDGLFNQISGSLTDSDLKSLRVYDWDVAVNGCDDIAYVDRLNLSTSGGYGHAGPKRKLFELSNSSENHAVRYEMTPDIKEECKYILQQYSAQEESNPVFKSSFKDEPITLDKEKRNKVRVFSGSPVAFSLIMRKYYLSLIRLMLGRRRLIFEMAIGANAHGGDWEEIYQHVVRHGVGNCFAGDYKNFDKQMPPELILGAFRVLIKLFQSAGWDEDDIKVATGIAYDVAYPVTDLFGTIVKFFGANPSGHVLTTPINSLVNSLYMRIACARILRKNGYTVGAFGKTEGQYINISNFSEIMSLVTYGDDNCGSINPQYSCINHSTIQEVLAHAGIVYTTDHKDATKVTLVPVSDITFLKRRFLFNEKLGRMGAPLDEESIFKSLTVWTYSKSISVLEQMAAVIVSANREYFFYGEEVFKNRHEFFKKLILEYKLAPYLDKELESFETIYFSLKL